MPIHDWTRVPAGLFHEFHQSWSVRIKDALNEGLLPQGFYALVEQRVGGPEPDVIAVETSRKKTPRTPGGGAAAAERPQARVVQALEPEAIGYARKANRITVRHQLGEVVAVIEIVSPGNKSGRAAVRDFVEKAMAFLRAGIHLLIVDLFPPGPRDPHGIHKAIWDEFREEPFELPPDQTRTVVGYDAGEPLTAYVETLGVGEALPTGPLFVGPGEHVKVPLEQTYLATWAVTPEPIRELVEGTGSVAPVP
jgi:hypothetical protein